MILEQFPNCKKTVIFWENTIRWLHVRGIHRIGLLGQLNMIHLQKNLDLTSHNKSTMLQWWKAYLDAGKTVCHRTDLKKSICNAHRSITHIEE
jgi:hypothetical protein